MATEDYAEPAGPAGLVKIGVWLGPLVFLAVIFGVKPTGLTPAAVATLALLAWMVIWWISEAVPIAITALLPIALLPLLGAGTSKEAAAPYADEIIFLFIGGFILALAIERWNLHSRIALNLARWIGSKPQALLASFLLASALISMWISNTATTLMLMPTAMGVARAMHVEGKTHANFAGALALAIAYAASIGGIGTPIGSPTNLIAMGYLEKTGLALSFYQWMLLAVPMMLVMLLVCWAILGFEFRRMPADGLAAADVIERARLALGKISAPEKRVLTIFVIAALAWMFRPLINQVAMLKNLTDTGIAIFAALLLFLLPAGNAQRSEKLMTWQRAQRLPWDVALLFGGGLSIAEAMTRNGVSQWLGQAMAQLGNLPPLLILFAIVVITIVVTEFVSNVATLTAMLPVVGAFSVAAGLSPLVLAFAASMAATLAFMMPIGTAPNAIAFGTGTIKISYMLRVGLLLNIASMITITLLTHWLAPWVL